jgi:hypothetical protein
MPKKVDPTKLQKTSLKLPPGLWREVRAVAILQGRSGNDLVIDALQRIVKESKGGRG